MRDGQEESAKRCVGRDEECKEDVGARKKKERERRRKKVEPWCSEAATLPVCFIIACNGRQVTHTSARENMTHASLLAWA